MYFFFPFKKSSDYIYLLSSRFVSARSFPTHRPAPLAPFGLTLPHSKKNFVFLMTFEPEREWMSRFVFVITFLRVFFLLTRRGAK